MKSFRTVLFWMHLACGAVAGLVILVMSVTGVALMYEKQTVEWADRRAWTAPSSTGQPLSPETLLALVVAGRPEAAPTGITMRADAAAPATVALEGNKTLLVDPYSGRIIGEPPAQPRAFFRLMTTWHRYLALEGASRATGRALTGAANLIFLFVVLSGTYLWVPRVWSAIQFRNVLWFRSGLASKARDFNWHNVIGIWSAMPLVIIVAAALPMSYPWANSLAYRLVGEAPPAPPQGGGPAQARGGERSERASAPMVTSGLAAAWSAARSGHPKWRTMTTRLSPSTKAPFVITVDDGYGGQPQLRATVSVDRATAEVTKIETFNDLSAGRQLRSWLRFAHTGEYYGLTGQTIAGLATAGGAVLVYTGIALALRRFAAWMRRRSQSSSIEERQRAA